MNSAISGLIVAAVTLAIIVQSVNSLTCYTGGGAGAAAIYLPGECDAKETLCKFKNGSAAGIEFKLAQGCEEASATKKAGMCDSNDVCYCNTDKCNGQTSLRPGMVAVVISVFATLKFFH